MSVRHHHLFLALMSLRFGLAPLLYGSIVARVHDNLDSTFVYNVLTARFWLSGLDPTVLATHMNGELNWTHFGTLIWPLHIVYLALPPALAYAAIEFGVVMLSYAGMYLLTREMGIRIAGLMASLFAMTLSFSTLGLGLAAAPLVSYLALRRSGPWVWAIMFLIGWNSGLILHIIFIPVVIFVVAKMLKRPLRPSLVPVAFLFAGSLVGSLPLFAYVASGELSHRTLWPATVAAFDAGAALEYLVSNALTQGSWYHATITPALYTFVFLSVGVAVARREALLVLAVFSAAIILNSAGPWLAQSLPGPFASLQYHRIGQFVAFLTILLGAIILRSAPAGRTSKVIRGMAVLTLIQAMLVWLGLNTETVKRLATPQQRQVIEAEYASAGLAAALKLIDLSPGNFWRAVSTVPRHMRSEDYACIAKTVGQSRVVSAGPDPMLPALHGINVLDGYHYLYPATWHTRFRPVIAAKLEKSASLRQYYDEWGSRVSLFIDQVPDTPPDYDALRNLRAEYVISDRELPLTIVLPTCGLSDDLMLYRL